MLHFYALLLVRQRINFLLAFPVTLFVANSVFRTCVSSLLLQHPELLQNSAFFHSQIAAKRSYAFQNPAL